MMILFRIAMMLVLVCCAPALAQAQKSGAGIAAIVNDSIVSNSDVDARVNLIMQGARAKPNPAMLKQLRQQSLQNLIDEEIRMAEIRKQDIVVEDAEIEDGIDKLAIQNNIPPDKFRMLLRQVPGNLETLRNQMKVQAGWGKLVRQKLRAQVVVSDNEIDAYLAEQQKQTGKMQYEVAEIVLPFQDDLTERQAKNLAQNILTDMAEKHTRFSVMAKEFSQGAEASKGGLLGWVKDGQLEPALNDVLKTMAVGDATPPIKASNAYHILFLKDKKEAMSLEQSNKKIQIKQLFIPAPPQAPEEYVARAFQQMKTWQSQATDCVTMQKIINANPSPLSRDMGMVALSDMPPPVIAMVKDAPTGKALEPVRAADGFLLMMVCGRDDAVATETVRDAAANIIGSERLNRLQKRYFRDLKDAAFIDIKDQT